MRQRSFSKYLLVLSISILLSCCSIIPNLSSNQKEALLKENLLKWEKFELEGLIELNYKAFSFRKNIIIKKKEGKIRLDIFDSGLMGLSPAPFLSAYLDTSLVLRLPGNDELTEIPAAKLREDLTLLDYLGNTKQLLRFKKQILAENFLQLDDLNIEFSDQMQITAISHKNADYRLNLVYGEELDQMIFYQKGKIMADILIDRITFSDVNIKALNH